MKKRAAGRGSSWRLSIDDSEPEAPPLLPPPSRPAPRLAPPPASPLESVLVQIQAHLESTQPGGSRLKQVIRELLEARDEYRRVLDSIGQYERSIGTGASAQLWSHKQFFAELLDFIDNCEYVELSEVKPEFLSLSHVLDRVRDFNRLDPRLYKKSGLAEAVAELFDFFCRLEMTSFSFKSRSSMVNFEWIRAGWFWLEDDGSPGIVPKVFERTALPVLREVLEQEEFTSAAELQIAFAHCLEASDFCGRKTDLMAKLQKKLEKAFQAGLLTRNAYERLADEFGLELD
jgi:hypothetical protein